MSEGPGRPLTRCEPLARPVDLRRTLGPLRRGKADRCTVFDGPRVWRATRTPEGPATVCVSVDPAAAALRGAAWGVGAGWALDHLRNLAGADDDDSELAAMLAAPGGGRGREVLRSLHRRLAGLRIPATGAVTEGAVPAVLEQKVTGVEARRSYRALVARLGEPAPGPAAGDGLRLMLPPAPAALARSPSWVFHRAGVEARRAATVVAVCRAAHRLDPPAFTDPAGVQRMMASLPGIGPWSVAEVSRVALGDADAVSVGDYHLPDQVAWALAGKARGSDEMMLELLEPYRGQRGRVTRLIEAAGIIAPRFGPRMAVRSIASI